MGRKSLLASENPRNKTHYHLYDIDVTYLALFQNMFLSFIDEFIIIIIIIMITDGNCLTLSQDPW